MKKFTYFTSLFIAISLTVPSNSYLIPDFLNSSPTPPLETSHPILEAKFKPPIILNLTLEQEVFDYGNAFL